MEQIERRVVLEGLTPILFDRYPGDNNEQLQWMQKLYLDQDGKSLYMPAENVMSFLSAQNTESAPRRIMGKRWISVAKACLSYVTINPMKIPFVRNGKQITTDTKGAISQHNCVARVKKGSLAIPNPKQRPMLDTPWQLEMTIRLVETIDLREQVLRKLFDEGGSCIGLGTYRGLFGKFAVKKWE